jgi:hypothetical protein
MLPRSVARLCLASVALGLAACSDPPGRDLAGFRLGMPQDDVMEIVRGHGTFTCQLRGTIPRLTTCEGTTTDGPVQVIIRNGETVSISLVLDPGGRRPQRAIRRFVRKLGDPAWQERPFPPLDPDHGYHTLWMNRDSTRALALVCSGRRLEPPCTAELSRSEPAMVQARLDTLLGIHR